MNNLTDSELLRCYAESRSEESFTFLASRHVDFVYSAALRMVRDSHLAEDVTQGVFVALAKNAGQLAERPVLAGWLHRTAQNIAAQTVRTIERRRAREQEAAAMNELLAAESDASWNDIAPQLDAALGELSEPDRDALLLRYFEKKSAREMAQTLGISEDAAQKRTNRAVDRLREIFSQQGLTLGASGLVGLISVNAVQAAPAGLVSTISTFVALTGTSVSTATTLATVKTVAMTTMQKTLIAATIAVAAGIGIYEANKAAALQRQLHILAKQQEPLQKQVQQLTQQQDEAGRQLAGLREENERLNRNTSELLKLRGEVAVLRKKTAQETGASDPSTVAWKGRINALIQKLQQMPEKRIPEMQFLSDKDWANAGWDADVETDDGVRATLSKLRETARNIFLKRLRAAIQKYTEESGGVLPADITELASYFEPPVQEAVPMLQQYQLLQAGKLSEDRSLPLAKNIVVADEDYDSWHEITLSGASGSGFNKVRDAVNLAVRRFTQANTGQMPKSSEELAPYLSTSLDAVIVQKYLRQIAEEGGPWQGVPPEIRGAVVNLEPAIRAYVQAHGKGPSPLSDIQPYLTTPEQREAYQTFLEHEARSKMRKE